ncbi:unnamed protein product [Microthlaspi erraticum]|uniref:Uncharacterized protein n=1 Tax=Microthlaspi erraticum TaxID=1685480 RepID=A0A6D2JXK3_9BRAS|nr:unnamed protein product [Microthlaspi erraticum]
MGDSNSNSPSLAGLQASLPNPELTTVLGGTNIDFRPPVYTLLGMKQICEKRSLSSIELRIELRTQAEDVRMRIWVSLSAITLRNGEQDQELGEESSGSSSKKKKAPKAPTFPRSRSLLTTQRRLPAQEPHRASSFEPREGEDNTQRRRKSSKARRSSSTTGLDRVQTEETQLDRADGRADQEEPQFEIRDLNTIPCLTRSLPGVDGTPYGQYELPMLHQGQGSHTHFNDEEEEEEEPQARSSEPNNQLHGVLLMAVYHLQTTT